MNPNFGGVKESSQRGKNHCEEKDPTSFIAGFPVDVKMNR